MAGPKPGHDGGYGPFQQAGTDLSTRPGSAQFRTAGSNG